MKNNSIKEIYNNFILQLKVNKDIRDYFSNYLNKGRIIELSSFEKKKFHTCFPNMPSDYYSIENIITQAEVLTDKNEKYKIIEEFLGVNFEAPCDKYNLKIYDSDDKLIANTYDYLIYLDEQKNINNNKKLNK